jgi:hypothetical protein
MKSLKDVISEKDPHDLHEMVSLGPTQTLDEADMRTFVEETYYLLGRVLDRPLPKGLKNDIIALHKVAEGGISWATLS